MPFKSIITRSRRQPSPFPLCICIHLVHHSALSLHLGQSLHLRQGIPKKHHAEHSPRPGSHPQPRRCRFRGCRRYQRPTSCKLHSCLTVGLRLVITSWRSCPLCAAKMPLKSAKDSEPSRVLSCCCLVVFGSSSMLAILRWRQWANPPFCIVCFSVISVA